MSRYIYAKQSDAGYDKPWTKKVEVVREALIGDLQLCGGYSIILTTRDEPNDAPKHHLMRLTLWEIKAVIDCLCEIDAQTESELGINRG